MRIYQSFVVIVGLVLFSSPGLASEWDVTDTGQPYKNASFTLEEGTWMSVDVHPNGDILAFDMLGDIYTVATTGGNATLVHGGPAMVRMPRFSPDGDKLLYLSDESGGDNVWVSNIDGSQAKQITHETNDVINHAAWSPENKYIVTTKLSSSFSDLFTSELRTYHIEGGSGWVTVDSPSAYQNISEAQFSADGRYLYYTHKVGGSDGSSVFIDANHKVHAIMQRDLQTGETRELLKGFGGATTVQVSPNSQELAFVRRVKDKTMLFVYNLKTGEQRPVYDQLDRDMQGEWIVQGTYYPQYSWFPDGRYIAIWGKGKLFKVDTQTATAELINFKAQAQHRITDVGRFDGALGLTSRTVSVKAIRHLAISPDKQTVIFNALGRLWKKSLPKGKPQRLNESLDFQFEPSYSPDGKQLAYVEWDDEQGSALRVMDLASGKVTTVLKNRGVIRRPVFSADTKKLTYRIQTDSVCMGGYGNETGIYVVEVNGKPEPVLVSKVGTKPQFSLDGKRLYYQKSDYHEGNVSTELLSVDLAGHGERKHAIMLGADRSELSVSPNFKWVGFKEEQNYYAMPFTDIGGAMMVAANSPVTPVVRLSDVGGYNLVWSDDSSQLYWLLGDKLSSVAVEGMKYLDPLSIGLTVKHDEPKGLLAFTGARIITMVDNEDKSVIENGTLIVNGNRIEAIGTDDDIVIPSGTKIIDSQGKTIMPGLINMHGHLDSCYYESSGGIPQKQASLYASLAFGVTTNFDPYSSELSSYSSSEMQRAGVIVSPRTISVGGVIYGRSGKVDSVYTPINSFADAENVMVRKSALGGKSIKSYRQPLRSQRQQLMKAARDAGIMVSIEGESHYYNNISAVLDGHNTIEHNLPVANYYDDVVQLFANSETANTPTLVALFGEIMGENYIYQNSRSWEDPRIDSFVPEVTSGYSPVGLQYAAPLYARGMTSLHVNDERWEIGFKSVARSTKKLDDAGVLVNIGSHSQVQGMAMHWEMQLMAEGGMSNERVLRAATMNGAKTLGLDRVIGSLEVGKLADLIVLDANPLDNILNTKTVVQTMVGGRLYDSYSMDEIGNYDKPRSKFYWERKDHTQTGWNSAAAGQ